VTATARRLLDISTMSSLRKQGPITTDVCCYSMLWLQLFYHDRL
jgi:hypothetical protein